MVHIDHAFRRARFDDSRYLVGTSVANEIGDGFVIDEKLVRRNEAAGDTRHQALAEYTRERSGKLDAYLVLLRSRERIDDAVYSLRGVVRVERREDEVAGLGGGDRRRHRLGPP